MADEMVRAELNGIHRMIGELSGRQQATADEIARIGREFTAQLGRLEDLMRDGFGDVREAIESHAKDDSEQFTVITKRFAEEDGARMARWRALKRWSLMVGIISTAMGIVIGLVQYVGPYVARGAQ